MLNIGCLIVILYVFIFNYIFFMYYVCVCDDLLATTCFVYGHLEFSTLGDYPRYIIKNGSGQSFVLCRSARLKQTMSHIRPSICRITKLFNYCKHSSSSRSHLVVGSLRQAQFSSSQFCHGPRLSSFRWLSCIG